MSILTNHRYALITGIVLAVILAIALSGGVHFNQLALRALAAHRRRRVLDRPAVLLQRRADACLADAAADKGGPGGAGINKYVAPRALFWFRWSALVTWLAGAWLLGAKFVHCVHVGPAAADDPTHYFVIIGIGAWLGTIMLFNVWGLIWPNQKKILGIKPATDEEKAKARKVALYASRTNFILSIPMIMCMAASVHGLPI